MRLGLIMTFCFTLTLLVCFEKKIQPEEYTVEITENCSDTLSMELGNKGHYYHCGIGVTFSLKYKIQGNLLSVIIYDFEYQYKPSNKVPITELKFEKKNNHLKLISINDLHENYLGEFIYHQKFLRSDKFKRVKEN